MVMKHLRCATFIACLSALSLTAYAHSGAEHQREIIESLFGSKYLGDQSAQELVDYISQGMDFGDVTHEATLTKPGSSFLNSVREKFPEFKGTHREFGHWAFDGDIPKEVIDSFEKVYPGRSNEFTDLWAQFVRTRREAARLGLGLGKEGGRAAQSISSLAGSCHDLGDWTTPQTQGLPSIKKTVRDIERSYHRLLGNNSAVVSDFIDDLKSIPDNLSPADHANEILRRWKANARLHEATDSVLKQHGFKGKFNPIDYREIARFEKSIAKGAIPAHGVPKTGTHTTPSGAQVKPSNTAAAAKPKPAARPRIQLGKGVVKPAASTGKGAAKAAGRGVTKAASRGALHFLGRAAPFAADVGFWVWGNYKIEDDFTKGRISEYERKEKKAVNTGSAIGGAAGAAIGGYAGQQYADQNDLSGAAAALVVAGAAVVAGVIGDWVGGLFTEKTYEWVNRSPYAICCDAADIGDVDAMFFKGVYLHEGRYVSKDVDAAAWWFECAGREGDVRAQFYLGEYFSDVKSPAIPSMAVFWWKMAADSESTETKFVECKAAAAYRLSSCYFFGEGVDENDAIGLYYLNRASVLGNKEAEKDLQQLLARCKAEVPKTDSDPVALKMLGNYYEFKGGDESEKISHLCYVRAAKLGNGSAMNNLGNACWGRKDASNDIAKAEEWYKKAIDEGVSVAVGNLLRLYDKNNMWDDDTVSWLVEQANAGNAEACVALAQLANTAIEDKQIKSTYPFKDCSTSELKRMHVQLLERAEAMGSKNAKLLLAELVFNKSTEFMSDPSASTYEARLRDASFANYVYAQVLLGVSYRDGWIINKDEQKAALYFSLAALKGEAFAQREYAKCCYFGSGVPVNYGKAVKWSRLAATEGDAYAEYLLGWCYAHGQGIPQDKSQARYWLQKALKDGISDARQALAEL